MAGDGGERETALLSWADVVNTTGPLHQPSLETQLPAVGRHRWTMGEPQWAQAGASVGGCAQLSLSFRELGEGQA